MCIQGCRALWARGGMGPEFFQARRHCVHQNVVVCGMFDLRYTIHYKRHNHLHSLAKSVGTPLNMNALIVPFID